jgi:hypothetical protein
MHATRDTTDFIINQRCGRALDARRYAFFYRVGNVDEQRKM